ncbi:MAG: hypothetical protein JNK82_14070, partial [Myxococcaceae bacterium]|nr:hypothetical protein [Myxococcaceae bacterium]
MAATIIKLSEAYAHYGVRGGLGLGARFPSTARRRGRAWMDMEIGSWLSRRWDVLTQYWDEELRSATDTPELPNWALAGLEIMAAADEACVGVGFGRRSFVARLAQDHIAPRMRDASLGWLLDPNECCVLPKTRTPTVGCNVRSLSLHLALLPPQRIVQAQHLDPRDTTAQRTTMGVLLVPFPYEVLASDFSGTKVRGQLWGHLRLSHRWGRSPSPKALSNFVSELISECERQGRRVDVVVLPELALSDSQSRSMRRLASRRGVQLVIAGVHRRQRKRPSLNLATGWVRSAGRAPLEWTQAKHHRWRVEKWQVQNYGLQLSQQISWWEDIDVQRRSVV